jgi:outer membrane lipoprotein-sorting protein
MRKHLTILSVLILSAILIFSGIVYGDNFEKIKKQYKDAALVELDILIIIESKIFGDVDSADGNIILAADGRYLAEINNEIFLFDGKCLWDYSIENGQATRNCLEENETFESELSFIKNLDRYYITKMQKPDSIYRMISASDENESLPDSMTVHIRKSALYMIEYLDLNNDLNQVLINSVGFSDSVNNDIFKLALPDSVEIITLP